MAKGSSGRRSGSAAPRQKPVYGKTPSARCAPSSSSLMPKNIPGCTPSAHVIGAPRKDK